MGRIARKLCRFLLMFSTGFTSLSVLLLFPLIDHFLCLYAQVLILFHATPGHPSASVYMETTSTRNNLLEILIPKINIFGKKKLACYEWEPTKSILAQAKSAACKNLKARKKQQQQVAAHENPED